MTVTLADLKAHVQPVDDTDDTLLQGKLDAAIAWVTDFCGLTIDDDNPMPAPCEQAALMLAASLYENREQVVADGVKPASVPFGIYELIGPYRNYVFG